MAYQTLAGTSIPVFEGFTIEPAVAFVSSVIDATGEKFAYSGPVWFAERTGTKAIRKVGFRFGTVTKAGGSALTVSLQNVSTAAGPPMRPDETQDETVAIANADAGFVSNAWYQTANLSADRTVAFGELLSVVIEFDGGGRLASDVVNIDGVSMTSGTVAWHRSHSALKTGTWAVRNVLPNVILEFSDGTFGTLAGGFPCSALGGLSFNSGSATDEWALKIQFPGPTKIDGMGGLMRADSAGGDRDLVAYSGTTAMTNGTVSQDDQHDVVANGYRPSRVVFADQLTLTLNTVYRLAVKPTSTTSVSLAYFDVAAAGHLQAHVGGSNWCLSGRVDAGAWSDTATRRPFLWPYISAIDDGAGGSGGVNRALLPSGLSALG